MELITGMVPVSYTHLSYSKTEAKDKTWIPSWIQSNRVYLAKENERLTKGSRNYSNALVENTITYDGKIGKHNINLLAGTPMAGYSHSSIINWLPSSPQREQLFSRPMPKMPVRAT